MILQVIGEKNEKNEKNQRLEARPIELCQEAVTFSH